MGRYLQEWQEMGGRHDSPNVKGARGARGWGLCRVLECCAQGVQCSLRAGMHDHEERCSEARSMMRAEVGSARYQLGSSRCMFVCRREHAIVG